MTPNSATPTPTSALQRIPLWFLACCALVGEFALYAFVTSVCLKGANRSALALVAFVALPLLVRLLIALASYALSRWKGMPVPPELRMGPVRWLRFFAVEYAHLCVQNLLLIPFRGAFRTRAERAEPGTMAGDEPVVLLQHGYVNNGGVWFFTAKALERAGYRVFTIDQPPFLPIDRMADRLAARVDDVLQQTGSRQLTLVAHSMGGLICRAYLRAYGDAHVAKLITLGSPHYGTFHAYLAGGPNGHQMRPGNDWLEALGRTKVTVPFTSIYSVHDTVISPQDSSAMPEAHNLRLAGIGHVSMPSGAVARRALLKSL